MKEDDLDKVEISTAKKNFKKHLDLPKNKRIFFSGIFGAGKTYLLREFFAEESSDYYSIHLFPINYQVSSTENIFEYIKYDILLQLLDCTDLKKKQITEIAKSLGVKGVKNLVTLLRSDPRVNSVAKIGENLKKIYEVAKKTAEKEEITQFLDKITKQTGVYENDSITKHIRELLLLKSNKRKEGAESTKETVLIIDDLDRVDPAHIFRILNVFSAHEDIDAKANKFGFDKIILVGDYNNIKNIFHSKYGASTDFSGYIDKFFTRNIFHFENKKNLVSVLYRTFDIYPDPSERDNTVYIILCFLIINLIELEQFSTRNLYQLIKIHSDMPLILPPNALEKALNELDKLYSHVELKKIFNQLTGVSLKNIIENSELKIKPLLEIFLQHLSKYTKQTYACEIEGLIIDTTSSIKTVDGVVELPQTLIDYIDVWKEFTGIL